MTACFKLVRALRQQSPINPDEYCSSCVYFSRNLDETEFPHLAERTECCGLGLVPKDAGCAEMRTDNCSARKK